MLPKSRDGDGMRSSIYTSPPGDIPYIGGGPCPVGVLLYLFDMAMRSRDTEGVGMGIHLSTRHSAPPLHLSIARMERPAHEPQSARMAGAPRQQKAPERGGRRARREAATRPTRRSEGSAEAVPSGGMAPARPEVLRPPEAWRQPGRRYLRPPNPEAGAAS